ncbi:MAG: hypothetical protein IJV40_08375 [Oscillospiraceae bacterium]|nr:hypothetical protein [Oscillospiraceae bacterium]
MREDQNFEYDVQKRAKAGTAATLRAVVSIYVVYLAWTVLKGVLDGSSPVPLWLACLVAVVFTGAAIAFGVFTWKTYQRDKEAARLPAATETDEETEETEETES